ncbi:3-hydroxyisobutyrate dehydrogenase-like beta-hydroxyacid dehydrogenase [Streptosporangium album]|uniref:3-hydroxyisobutyrate dehydrogenase-like beta-hydroxyacid dehydrogenase n=1 Tax=Streptosporangium album TaxID=47479 RepID=A0A7W7W6H2_9ACTN|nr:NAD(P)-dependent oxidoreductase [Streptosporangium album]MBB4936267.1 3-hydroxyisobutyrate dehydrogenase-like beta-hydroxyacid dehydrogenase [Streptosporangium album]
MRVSVLGMGSMGRAMARRLLEHGHEVTVWNRTPGKAAEAVDAGAVEAPSPAEAARDAGAVLMSLADDQAVRAVMARLTDLGPDPGAQVVADMSTVSPDTSRALAELAPGGRFVAAPVFGGPQAVVEGQSMGLLGGERGLVDRLEPLWADLFAVHWYCGRDPGSALTFKLLNNYLMMAGVAVLAEAVATGQAAGLDEAMLRELLFQWPTVATGLHNRIDDILQGDHRGWFATRLGAKDVRLAVEVAESKGLRLPIARLIEQRYEEAAEHGWNDSDITAIVELVRARS